MLTHLHNEHRISETTHLITRSIDNQDEVNKCLDFSKLLNISSIRLSHLILIVLFWSLLWAIYGEPALPPNGHLFHLIILFSLSCICGQLCECLYCPPLFGALVIGFIYGNVLDVKLNTELTAILRSASLVVILLLAGLELNPKVVRKMSFVCLRMAFIPCLVEVISVTFATYFLLDFPLKWGFLLGFILSAASPAIVVPGMLSLQEKQLGTDKGIPTLVIAASSIDDILAITGFSVCLGQVFTTDASLTWTIMKGPVEAVMGIGIAIAVGVMLWHIPKHIDSQVERVLLLLFFGLVSMFVSQALDFESFGALACIVLSFVASIQWRPKGVDKPSMKTLKVFWNISEPLLFAMIGFEVRLSDLKSNAIGFAILSLIIGLVFRTIVSMIAIIGANLNFKEKIYVSLTWVPKATVQAAIGGIALDLANQRDDPKLKELANFVLTISVLSIVITAPLGAIWIAVMGSRCLEKAVPEIQEIEINTQIVNDFKNN